VQPADVHGHPLQHECGALPHRFIPSRRQLIEELLMAIDGTGRASRSELLLKENGVNQSAPFNAVVI
jgi:hypothetical protein